MLTARNASAWPTLVPNSEISVTLGFYIESGILVNANFELCFVYFFVAGNLILTSPKKLF